MTEATVEVPEETRNETTVENSDLTEAPNLYIVANKHAIAERVPDSNAAKKLAKEKFREEHDVADETELMAVAEEYANVWEVIVQPEVDFEFDY